MGYGGDGDDDNDGDDDDNDKEKTDDSFVVYNRIPNTPFRHHLCAS